MRSATEELLAACEMALSCLEEVLEDTDGEGDEAGEMVPNPLLVQLRQAIRRYKVRAGKE